MKVFIIFICCFFILSVVISQNNTAQTIAKGQMPYVTRDKNNTIHIVYGHGDSIMYISSNDGKSYSSPSLVAILHGLSAVSMRGPQIAAGDNGLIVTACTKPGNIFSYQKGSSGKWTKAVRVNDVSEQAREALMALSADGLNAYAVWLGVSGTKAQAIYGAGSTDGGKTWAKNILVYESPTGSVCECCKPSVVVKGKKVYVMFRNLFNGNRDLYLIQSVDEGYSFRQAKKLGTGSWKLNGCPMDGGGLVTDQSGNPETVWRREEKIYASVPGIPEKEIGEGRGCSIETVNNKNIYAWTEKGNVVVLKPGGLKVDLGKGSLPLLKALNENQVVCVWENDKQILGAVLDL